MGEAGEAMELLKAVRHSSDQLLKACGKLVQKLPVGETHFAAHFEQQRGKIDKGGSAGASEQQAEDAKQRELNASYAAYLNDFSATIEWPTLLGDFRGIAHQLAALNAKAENSQLKHVVAVPTDPAAQPNGMPSMIVPELLRTKRPPEQEAQDEQVRKKVKGFDGVFVDDEAQATGRANELRTQFYRYNSMIGDVIKGIKESESHRSLHKQMGEIVTQYSVSAVSEPPKVGIQLLSYVHRRARRAVNPESSLKAKKTDELKSKYNKAQRKLPQDVFSKGLNEVDLRLELITRILQYKCRKYGLPDNAPEKASTSTTYRPKDNGPLVQRIMEYQKGEKYLREKELKSMTKENFKLIE